MNFGFDDSFYAFQALRAASPEKGADRDEVLQICQSISDGNEEEWYRAWNGAAEKRLKQGDLFKASNYFRTAAFMLSDDDLRSLEAYRRSRDAFQRAVAEEEYSVQRIAIPYEETTLPGYLCLSDGGATKQPLLLIQSGFDGTAEEVYLMIGRAALQRGYHVLIFEGPGQGAARREQNLVFRHDWEAVVTPAVDFALNLPQVDPQRIALLGISMGGYLVPRALAYEHRIAVGIANGGVYDFHSVVMHKCPPGVEEVLDLPEACVFIDEAVEEMMTQDPSLRWAWAIRHGMYVFGADSPSEWMRMTRPYHLRDCARQIRAKMLIVDSEKDEMVKDQARPLYEALECPKDFMLFTEAEGAGGHCQAGAFSLANQRILDWLDAHLPRGARVCLQKSMADND